MKSVRERFELEGRVAIVSGGRGLYGAGIVEGLCEMGASVVVASRDGAACEAFARGLRERGCAAWGMSLDLSDDASIAALANAVYERFGRIDILVNNAVDRRNLTDLEQATRRQLRASADSNLHGHILLAQAVVAYMRPQRRGTIINISSVRGLDCPHFPFYPEAMRAQPVNYTTEKWAMIGLTKYMAGRYGAEGIRVNCIAPGGFNPGLADEPSGRAFVATYAAHCPLGRWANEDDIKGPVVFLASEASSYMTGATLVVDGGWTIW